MTTNSFTVTWTAPDSEMFTGYEMTVSEGDNVKTQTPAKDVTSVEVTELTSGTEYTVKLVTINNQDESSMLTTAASTRKLRLLFILYSNKQIIETNRTGHVNIFEEIHERQLLIGHFLCMMCSYII